MGRRANATFHLKQDSDADLEDYSKSKYTEESKIKFQEEKLTSLWLVHATDEPVGGNRRQRKWRQMPVLWGRTG